MPTSTPHSTPTATEPAPTSVPTGPAPTRKGSVTKLTLTALGIQFDRASLTAPADTAFQIVFDNQDVGIPHGLAIHAGAETGRQVWKGAIVNGPAIKVYSVPALPAGRYRTVCQVHPNMVATLTVK